VSAPIRCLSASQRPVFLLNSRSSLFVATPTNPARYSAVLPGHPFSRSYGVNLPSSLTRVLSRALGSSPRLPVSVCGTVTPRLARGFSGPSLPPLHLTLRLSSSSPRSMRNADLPALPPWRRTRSTNPGLGARKGVPPSLITSRGGAGISTCSPSTTPFGLALGPAKLKGTNLP